MKIRYAAVGLCALLIVLGAVPAVLAVERKESVLPSELPGPMKKLIEDAFPDAEIVRIEKEVEGEDVGQYDVLLVSGGQHYEVEISAKGKIIEKKKVRGPAKSRGKTDPGEPAKEWTRDFQIEKYTFSSTGRNRYFILEPGHQLVLEGEGERVTITILDETEVVGGIETRILEEREEKDGELAEISRNYFAICNETGDVFYFGEEVDIYENGKVVRHSGEWRADEPDSQAGIIMPGRIWLGARHYQEIAPTAMDRAEIVSDTVTMKTPVGTFTNCLRVEETSGLDPYELCYKTYAPDIGMIQDEELMLVKYSFSEK